MKRIISNLILCVSIVLVTSCSDSSSDKNDKEVSESGVPAEVKTAFSAKYSTASDVRWEDAHEDSLQTYKAKFTLNGKKMKAEFDAKGNFVKEEEDN